MNTEANASILTPEQVHELVIKPVDQQSVASQTSTVVPTESHALRVPIVGQDPTAAWTAEGAEIAMSDLQTEELTITPLKLAVLSVVSNELAADSSPAAAATVGAGMARDVARAVDRAFFGTGGSGNVPAGLAALTGMSTVNAGSAFADLDWAAEAVNLAEREGATITSFATNPVDALALARISDEDGSRRPLLGSDPTRPTTRTIFGIPVVVSPAVPAATIWAIPSDKSLVVRRTNVQTEISREAFFSSDRTAIRTTLRTAFGWPHPEALVKITIAP